MELVFTEPNETQIIAAAKPFIMAGRRRVSVLGPEHLATSILTTLRGIDDQVSPSPADAAELGIIVATDAASVSENLMSYLDADDVVVIAPKTEFHRDKRPLFVISIPKSGTHLLFRLCEALGFPAAGAWKDEPSKGHWNYVEFSNSHTVARDFMIDTLRRSPHGNRDHPFATSPCIFMYRHPLDILISEAHYYHKDGNSPFAGYLQDLSFDERVRTLIDDPWLLGSIRDRVGGFLPWMSFPNVVPVAFEDIVGAAGGGDDTIQRRVIWSLQLKLHAPGKPEEIATKLFDRDSPTFRKGMIGSAKEELSAENRALFEALDQDFMSGFGYTLEGSMPAGTDAYLRRPLRTAVLDERTPYLCASNRHGHNIVKYQGTFVAIPLGAGDIDIRTLGSDDLAYLYTGNDLSEVLNKLEQSLFMGWRILPCPRGFVAVRENHDVDKVRTFAEDDPRVRFIAPTIENIRFRIVRTFAGGSVLAFARRLAERCPNCLANRTAINILRKLGY